jgi:hypothetical protein
VQQLAAAYRPGVEQERQQIACELVTWSKNEPRRVHQRKMDGFNVGCEEELLLELECVGGCT